MAIVDIKDKAQKWRYEAKEIKIIVPKPDENGKPLILSLPKERLVDFSIEDNYEENYFPLFKITLALEAENYYEILKAKNSCGVVLRIDKYYTDINNKNKSLTKTFINDTFELIMDEDTDDMYSSLKEEETKTNYKIRSKSPLGELSKVNSSHSFYLFKSTVNTLKNSVNAVLSKANVSDAIAFLATRSFTQVLMSQPDNTTVYDELIIPPMSLLKAFSFIDTYYGLYKTGSLIYFGLDTNYIIPYNGKCTAYKVNELQNTNIIIPKSMSASQAGTLCSIKKYNDRKSNYIVGDYKTINIENQSISNNYINANDLQSVDSYSGESTKVDSNAKSKKENFIKVHEDKTENKFIASTYAAQTNAKSVIISVRLQDYDIFAISPNKKFNMIFEDSKYTSKYNGEYILSGAVHTFINEGASFALSSVLVLKQSSKKK